jgi:hypothetical protein
MTRNSGMQLTEVCREHMTVYHSGTWRTKGCCCCCCCCTAWALTRGAGPRIFLPVLSYWEPWHGHLNLFSAWK